MRRITGTVIKIIDGKAAIMTKDCEILYIKKQPGMYLGLEIRFGANEIISNKDKLNLTIKIVSSIAAIFIFVFLNLHFFHKSDSYTYICIDGKSSIEFTVDNDMNVVNATSIDKKSQENLMKINLKSKSLKIALSAVLNNNIIIQDGYSSDDCIIISAYTKNKNDDQNYVNKNIEKALLACKNSVDELDNVNCRFVGIDNDARRLAVKNNISMGRYYIFERAQEQGINISIEQAKDMKVGELIKKINIPYLSITNDEKKTETKDENSKKYATPLPAISKEIVPSQINTSIPDNKNLHEVIDTKDAHTKKVHPTPIPPKADEIKVHSTPIPPKEDEIKVHPTPIPPKADEIKVHPTPIPPKADEIKVYPTPIPPKADEIKVYPTPIPPKADEIKVHPTPIPPKEDEIKVHPTPIPPKEDEIKVHPTPIPPKEDEIKVHPTPIPPKEDEIKVHPTPIPPKEDEIRVHPTPIPPKTDEIKVPSVEDTTKLTKDGQ